MCSVAVSVLTSTPLPTCLLHHLARSVTRTSPGVLQTGLARHPLGVHIGQCSSNRVHLDQLQDPFDVRVSVDRKCDGTADIPPPEVEEPWEWKKLIPPPSFGCGYRGPAAPPPVSTPTALEGASVLPMAPSTSPPAPQHANSDGGMARRDDHMANNDGNGAITQCDDDVLSHIFHHLDARSLLRCASVCARWRVHVTSRQDTTWQRLCHRQWPWTWTKSTSTWKDEHRRRTLLDRAWASRDGKGQVVLTCCVHIGFVRAFAPRRSDAVCWLNLVVT